MRTLLFVTASALALAADGGSLDGDWLIQRSAAGNQSEQTCSLSQLGKVLTGSCKSEAGTVEIKGKVDGKSVTWTYKGDSAGGVVTVVYEGTIESDAKIIGKVTAVEFSIEGEFTATRTK